MAPVITTPAGAYIVYLVYRLGKMYAGKTIIEYLPLVLGKYIGKLLGLGYILFFIWVTSSVICEFNELLLGTGVFVKTPVFVIGLVLLSVTTYAAYSGLEVIARSFLILWFLALILFSAALFMSVPLMDLSKLSPFGAAGLLPILKSSITPHMYTGEIVLLAMLFPLSRATGRR